MGELVPWVIKSELQLVFWGMICLMSGRNEGSQQNCKEMVSGISLVFFKLWFRAKTVSV